MISKIIKLINGTKIHLQNGYNVRIAFRRR